MKLIGKITLALLNSFIIFWICYIVGYSLASGHWWPADYIFTVAFPFCGAYVGFCKIYSGKLYVKIGNSALILPALFGIIPVIVFITILGGHRYWFEGLGRCCLTGNTSDRPIEAAISELNGRENLRWANIKASGIEFQTDADIEKEVMYGKTLDRWNTNLGRDYKWTEAPTATGGTISFQSGTEVTLTRNAATLKKPAKWLTTVVP